MNSRFSVWMIPLSALALSSVACSKKNTFVAPPPPSVTVQHPSQRDVTIYANISARTESFKTIEIRARVAGFLRSVEFLDGQIVEAGQLLFKIEPEQYQATLETAKAQLAQSEALAELAKTTLERKELAYKTEAVSELDVLSARAELNSANASVRGTLASVKQAELNLSYTEVVAPLAGRVSRSMVNIGNLVGAGTATLLTTLVVEDPVFVYAELDERMLLPILRRVQLEQRMPPAVKLMMADGVEYPEVGAPDYIDPTLDPETGTITVRAVFPNPDKVLKAGMFARLMIPRKLDAAILIPELAIQKDMVGSFVLRVNPENRVEAVYITTGPRVDGNLRAVTEGLSVDDRVITGGMQRARPGSPVTVLPAQVPVEKVPAEG